MQKNVECSVSSVCERVVQTTERTQKIYGAMKKDMKFQYDTRVQRDAD